MPRAFSISARAAFNAPAADLTPILLVTVRHPDWASPYRLASDYTVRLSADPLRYGVVSGGATYEFLVMSGTWPDDQDAAPPSFQLVFMDLTPVANAAGIAIGEGLAGIARAISPLAPAAIDLALVLAAAPDVVETRATDFQASKATITPESLTLDVARQPVTAEPWPAAYMTRARFPGLFR